MLSDVCRLRLCAGTFVLCGLVRCFTSKNDPKLLKYLLEYENLCRASWSPARCRIVDVNAGAFVPLLRMRMQNFVVTICLDEGRVPQRMISSNISVSERYYIAFRRSKRFADPLFVVDC